MNITPLPWIAEDYGHGIYIEPACVWLGNTTRHGNEVVRANAEYIVCAVNSHAELLAALEELADAGAEVWGVDRPCVREARAAIAKAKGKA